MGITAETLRKNTISREAQDAFAFESQQKAIQAIDSGTFKDEIVPLELARRKDTFVFDTDEFPNRTTTLEKMAGLRPAFRRTAASRQPTHPESMTELPLCCWPLKQQLKKWD